MEHCTETTRMHTLRTPSNTSKSHRSRLVATLLALVAACSIAGMAPDAAAQTARETLQSYLNARQAGELETARGLWHREEMRRSRAMGMRFSGVEASYDSYWHMSAEERQHFVEHHDFEIEEENAKEDATTFRVKVVSKKDPSVVGDTWRYAVRKDEAGWRVSLPLMYDSRSWTKFDGRFVKIRSRRVARINKNAVQAMDRHIDSLFTSFATPKAAQLRLERVKYEVFIVEDDDEIASLLGSARHGGYRPGNERVLTTLTADFGALAEAVATLTLRKTEVQAPAFFSEGLAVAWGGRDDLSANVVISRTRNRVQSGKLAFDLPFTDPDHKKAIDVRALWNYGLFELLGQEKYFELYASMRGTPRAAHHRSMEEVRQAIEAAAGKKGKALADAVLEKTTDYASNIDCECEQWPPDIRGLRSVLSWQDLESSWAMKGYRQGANYTFALGAHRSGMPTWAYNYVDSIARANNRETPFEAEPEPERPEGDPPYLVVTFTPRVDVTREPYSSKLFEGLFANQDYLDEMLSLFVSYDHVRVYNYRLDRLVGEYDAMNPKQGAAVFYDEELGRVCFNVAQKLFPRDITHYTPRAGLYTGE